MAQNIIHPSTKRVSIADRFFVEELLHYAGPEISLQWLSLHEDKRIKNGAILLMTKKQISRGSDSNNPLATKTVKLSRNCWNFLESRQSFNIRSNCNLTARRSNDSLKSIKCPDASCGPQSSTRVSCNDSVSQISAQHKLPMSSSCPEFAELTRKKLIRSTSSENFGLLFTDAAHTVLDLFE